MLSTTFYWYFPITFNSPEHCCVAIEDSDVELKTEADDSGTTDAADAAGFARRRSCKWWRHTSFIGTITLSKKTTFEDPDTGGHSWRPAGGPAGGGGGGGPGGSTAQWFALAFGPSYLGFKSVVDRFRGNSDSPKTYFTKNIIALIHRIRFIEFH